MAHLTIYELRAKYSSMQEQSNFYRLFQRLRSSGELEQHERAAGPNDPAIVHAYCERQFCQAVYNHRTETYCAKLFSRNFRKIANQLDLMNTK
jgi:hypothetical protein